MTSRQWLEIEEEMRHVKDLESRATVMDLPNASWKANLFGDGAHGLRPSANVAPDIDHVAPDIDHVAPDIDHVAPDIDHVAPDIDHVHLL